MERGYFFFAAGLDFFFAAGFFTATEVALFWGLSGLASGAGLVSAGFSASLASAFFSVPAGSLSSPSRLRFFSCSDLKSVSYQPPPFKRNTGAETSRFKVCFLQLGHCLSGGSEIF